jgi:hypothetical protein
MALQEEDQMTEALERELATYRARLPELSAEQGKFILIHGDEVLGIYDSYQDALTAGYEKAGLDPFLVKRISAVETVAYFSRELVA